MSNITSTLAKRLRTRSISLPITSTQRAVFPKSLNPVAAKQRAANLEPSINTKDRDTKSKTQDSDNIEQEIAYMATYSAFDPGATHPLLLSSALLISVSDLASNSPLSSDSEATTRRNTIVADPGTRHPSTTAGMHRAVQSQHAVSAPMPEKVKPWPYSLPKPLRPQAGTTWDLIYGGGVGVGDIQIGRGGLGVLQRVLYGVPEPREKDGEEDRTGC